MAGAALEATRNPKGAPDHPATAAVVHAHLRMTNASSANGLWACGANAMCPQTSRSLGSPMFRQPCVINTSCYFCTDNGDFTEICTGPGEHVWSGIRTNTCKKYVQP
jgi:hypothetical protein